MLLEELELPLGKLKGIGPASQKTLAAMGLLNVQDLAWHLPRDYEDRSQPFPFASAIPGGGWTNTLAVVQGHEYFGGPGKKNLKIIVQDDTAQASLTCFGRDFLARQLPVGTRIRVCGNAQYRFKELQIPVFEFELFDPSDPEGKGFMRILPRYPLGGDLNQGFFRRTQERLFSAYLDSLDDFMPTGLVEKRKLMHRTQALHTLHMPTSQAGIQQARFRLVYEELLLFQMEILRRTLIRKGSLDRESAAPVLASMIQGPAGLLAPAPPTSPANTVSPSVAAGTLSQVSPAAVAGTPSQAGSATLATPVCPATLASSATPVSPANSAAAAAPAWPSTWPPPVQALLASLPFGLTPGQTSAFAEILADLDQEVPMARLLQGDVGSGKTLVALMSCLYMISRGHQAALLVPTVLLARQHAATAWKLLAPLGVEMALMAGPLTGPARKEVLASIKDGRVRLVIGTHGLFSQDVEYRDLRMVVIDEQHRFGVAQRKALHAKAQLPHLLMMSATPIPQTLALTVFGDMEVSLIRDLPSSRKPIDTHLARMGNEQKVYDFVRREILEGRQAYFVYPLIEGEDDEAAELKNAQTMYETLARKIYPDQTCAMIHSRLEESEKASAMEDFASGRTRILVATSVVEVGVDVPNATCMVIEHAERFGLSALHQLRGRVGRGSHKSYCFLVYRDPLSEEGKRRLMVMKEEHNGFVIAEEDLKLRGPGDLRGLRQSGLMKLKIADLSRDMEILHLARSDARSLLAADPGLTRPEHLMLDKVLALVEKHEAAADSGQKGT